MYGGFVKRLFAAFDTFFILVKRAVAVLTASIGAHGASDATGKGEDDGDIEAGGYHSYFEFCL